MEGSRLPVYRVPRGDLSRREVYVSFGRDAYAVTREVLRTIPYDFTQLRGRRVLIKPNAGRLVAPNLGINTSPAAVAAVADFLLDWGISNIVVGDSPILGVTAPETLAKSGIAAAALERKIDLADLDAEPPQMVSVPNPKVVKTLRVCRKALETDFIISVPVMKTHMHTQVSLGLKNMKGCLYKREKVRLHQLPPLKSLEPPAKPLDMAIADLAKILLPDLTVIDGSIGQEGLGPSAGEAKPFGAVVASFNCLAADATAARLMGSDPELIHHLRLAFSELERCSEERLHGLADFRVVPEDYMKWATPFQQPPSRISIEYDNVRLNDSDSCSACLSTVLMFLKRYQAEMADYFNADFPLRLAIGKGIGAQERNTILIGNCTIQQKAGCVFVRGCPPVASDIMKALKSIQNMRRNPDQDQMS